MATGDTAPPPLSIPPPPTEPLSDDDGSSPLSDVEDKDDDPDDIHGRSPIANHHDDEPSSPDNLSDANDTEAETERLYDTPRNPTRHKDVPLDQSAAGSVYERTPSKLRQANSTVAGGNYDDSGRLSDEDVSMASSPPAQPLEAPEKLQSPTLDILAEAANQEAENRKRKRPPVELGAAEPEQPLRKRTESAPPPSQEVPDNDIAMADEDDPSSNTNSGEHSADEGVNATAGDDEVDKPPPGAPSDRETGPRKPTRSSSRKLKGPEDKAERGVSPEAGVDGTAPEEDGAHTGDDEHMEVDVDGEAEAAHKNEEERMADLSGYHIAATANSLGIVERKRAAFEQLSSIEKRFATFRDRLYEERLEQLNQEEAMLRSDNPTHPEYLAMMKCIDARRDEKLRVADRELELRLEMLERLGVAKRAQIHSQYFQAVRESRETVLAELGQHWYDIQHERRKHADNVPEYGIRFPQTHNEHVRNALAYNKEVSILSGIAKYEGMPAAPDMPGASLSEVEDDFDAMNRGRQQAPRHSVPRPSYTDYRGVPFGEPLGPAAEQFLEQTPWANPNHPSNAYLLQRQHSAQQETQAAASVLTNASAGSRRQTSQPNPFSISSASQPFNGNAKPSKSIPRQDSESPEVTRAANVLEQTKARSMKAAETAAKRENGQRVGGF
ncbi:Uu.00g009810.m01.CDS01 [Anthostomella pinea]|uniref:Uu.00g009810.m01.CDS01 n=1 Tax=Anthostomella pinea TaxID=933095 RepID=A0AAI8VXF6_9PEZI|nr:Uu.00g009810.m01.CDS01 [Anthostomella pinea]